MKNAEIDNLKFCAIAAVFFLSAGKSALACGPFFTDYLYSPEDINRYRPLQDGFLDGNYGVISDGLGLEYAYPVYQDLIGKKVTQEIRNELEVIYGNGYYNVYLSGDTKTSPLEEWYKARESVTQEKSPVIKTDLCENWQCYENCHGDAFIVAAKTLKERMNVFTKDELRIWLAGQDRVFSFCGQPAGSESGANNKINTANLMALVSDAVKSNIAGSQNSFSGFFSSIRQIFTRIFRFFRDTLKKQETVAPGLQGQENAQDGEKTATTGDNAELLRYDQGYQDAAAAFYRGDYDLAAKQFQAIVDNPSQPWRAYAALALGRIDIRKGNEEIFSQGNESNQASNENFKSAKEQFQAILNDSGFVVVQEGARSLLDYINFRIDPRQRFKDAANVLATGSDQKEIARSLDDLSSLWYYVLFPYQKGDFKESQENSALVKESGGDFLQWYYVWTDPENSENNFDFAFNKYQETKTLPWLLACLKLVSPTSDSAKTIIDNASRVPIGSPAYLTTQYYRLKLLAQISGTKDETRREIAAIIAATSSSGPSSYIADNYFNDLMMNTTVDLDVAARYAPRYVVASLIDSSISKNDNEIGKVTLDEKFKSLMNRSVLLEKWASIASGDSLSTAEIKEYAEMVAFTRAVLLERWDVATNMAKLLSKDNALTADLSPFLSARTAEDQKFTAVFFMLRNPQIRKDLTSALDDYVEDGIPWSQMDDYRRNWWLPNNDQGVVLQNIVFGQDRQTAIQENDRMNAIVAPNYFCETAINYGSTHPNDPLVPEALARAVGATRYAAYKDGSTGDFSKRAYMLLHANYPRNVWTQQTPYWYGENN